MQLFKQKSSGKTSNKKLNFKKNRFFSKKRFLPVAGIFGLVGGYLVYQSFAYTPLLAGANGEFVALAPSRIMDTRNGNGGYNVAIPANGTYSLQVTGRGGVPAVAGVKSVVMSVAVVSPTANGFLTVWPSGVSKPNASNINFVTGQNIANQVTVPVGADGKVQFSSSASTHIIVDISGYYSSENGVPGSRYNALTPARILDTRNGTGGFTAPLPNNGVYDVQVLGEGGVPTSNVSAVVVNVVAVNPTANGYTTVWPAGIARPDSSSLNYVSGKTVAKLVTVPIGANGKVSVFNSGSATNYIFDVAGYYSGDDTSDNLKTQEGRFVSLNPARIMDTRNGTGGYNTAIPANGTYSLTVNGSGGVPTDNVKAVVVNITAVNPTANGFLTAWPSGVSKPNASNINFVNGQTTANQAILLVGDDGKIQLSSSVATNIIVDVAGYFIDYEDQFMGTSIEGSVINYSDGNIQFIDMTTLNQLAFDLNINELPNTDVKKVSYRNQINSHDANYANYKYHSLEINNQPKDGKTTILTQCFTDCKNLSPVTNTFDGLSYTNYTFPYSLQAGKSYTITRDVLASQTGYTGRRLVTSITVDGIKKELITERLEDGSSINTRVNLSTMTEGYSCKSTNSWSHDIGNIKVNGVGGRSLWTNGPVIEENPLYIVNCKGYVKGYYSQPALNDVMATRVNGTPIVSGDTQVILGFKIGIPKAERDTQPPVISNPRNESIVCNDAPAIKTTYTTDDNSLVAYTIFKDYYDSVFQQSRSDNTAYWCSLAPGSYTENIRAIDDSGNVSTYPVTVTIP